MIVSCRSNAELGMESQANFAVLQTRIVLFCKYANQ